MSRRGLIRGYYRKIRVQHQQCDKAARPFLDKNGDCSHENLKSIRAAQAPFLKRLNELHDELEKIDCASRNKKGGS